MLGNSAKRLGYYQIRTDMHEIKHWNVLGDIKRSSEAGMAETSQADSLRRRPEQVGLLDLDQVMRSATINKFNEQVVLTRPNGEWTVIPLVAENEFVSARGEEWTLSPLVVEKE